MRPRLILIHETAGSLTRFNSRDYLCDNPRKVSCHLVIERDGTVSQLADFDRVTYHAGKSEWRGVSGCNGLSIGIELVGPGRLDSQGYPWFKTSTPFLPAVPGTVPGTKPGYWLPFTEAQYVALERVVRHLVAGYPIEDIRGHWEVSPGRKEDPNATFDWRRVRALLASVPPAPPMAAIDVRRIQTRLAELYYSVGEVDGVMGSRTSAALFAFQIEQGLHADGQLTQETLDALYSSSAKPWPTGHREEMTEAGLEERQDHAATAAKEDRIDGSLQTVLGAVTALAATVGGIIKETGPTIAVLLVATVVVYLGIRQISRGNSLSLAALRRYVTGG